MIPAKLFQFFVRRESDIDAHFLEYAEEQKRKKITRFDWVEEDGKSYKFRKSHYKEFKKITNSPLYKALL